MKTYIVDTDVLIGFRQSLPMQIFKTQWKMLKDYVEEGRIIICEAVFHEVKKAEDLKNWLANFNHLVVDCYTKDVIIEAKTIINAHPNLIDANNPSDQSDPYLIALAKIKNYCVLTNESYSEGGKKTKIPYICKQLSIDYMNTEQFYEEEKWEF
ncbi:MAG: DUF4411 family protein [Candidatus Daviesbacteria bacterium]|nr:DUF4411 family protein [Candidatus Daviesbacteria bacterium]